MQFNKPVKLNENQINRWMHILFKRAERVGEQGEIPVAAVILNHKGNCIGHGRNTRNKNSDPLGHAELVALKQASWIKGDWRFNECTLIVTLEPCLMCSSALVQARMGRIIFGAVDKKRGGLGGSINLSTHKSSHHKMEVVGGVLEDLVSNQIKEWFAQKRLNKIKSIS